jgi:poly-gamma-glutamate synthesis protein (capsule biosynthesis protein)
MSGELLKSAETDGTYNFSNSFAAITAYTASADLTLADLELNFVPPPYEESSYRAPQSFAQTLRLSGIDLVQTANCAAIQTGMSGLASTIDALDSAGIEHVGTYRSEEELLRSNGVLIKNMNGLRIAFVSFSKGLGGLTLPQGKEFAADVLYEDYATDYSVLDKKTITQRLAAANNAAPDLIIALLHWGNEFDAEVTKKQEEIADLLIENNVRVILGTHPNNVGKIELRKLTTEDGVEKQGYVAYSLGNFFTANQKQHANESIIVNFEIKKNGLTGETTIENFTYTPIFINQDLEKATYEILPVRSAINSSLFEEKKEELTDCLARLRQQTQSDFDDGR